MRKLVVLSALIISLASVGCTRVGPGYVGIKVSMAGSNKGVSDVVAKTGWVFYNPAGTSIFEYPTFVQSAVWTASPAEGHPSNEEISFSTGDSMRVSADISLAYQLDPDKVPAFYVKFRSDDLDKFTHGFLRNLARQKFDDVAGKYKIDQVMGDNGPFLHEVRASLQAELDPIGVSLQQFGFIGAPRPPEGVIAAINQKVQATQIAIQKENELRQAEAEAKKTVATAEGAARAEIATAEGYATALTVRSKADAEANDRVARSLTPLLVDAQRVRAWNGVMPQVTSGGNPFITLK